MSHSQECAPQFGSTQVRVSRDADTGLAARLLRRAAESVSLSSVRMADSADVGASKVAQWLSGQCAPSLMHLVRLAATQPALIEAVARELVALAPDRKHVSRPLPDRCLSLLSEAGDVAKSIQAAVADGNVDADEAASIRRELQHARQVLDAIERDLAGK